MNKIELLIDKLCPNGVEFRNLGEILDYEQPTKYIVKTTDYNDEFSTPVLTAGQSFILGYTDEKFGIYTANKNNACIIFDDFTTSFHWVDFDFKVKSSALKILKPFISCENEINFKFVFYAMKCILFNPAEHSRNWISKYSKIKIPIPPIEIQNEIVKILDSFTELQTQLQTELQTRKKQYAYYRNKLLSIKELQKRSNDVKIMNLGEVFTRVRTKVKDAPNIQVFSVSKNQGIILSDEFRERQIHSKQINNYTFIKKGMFAYNPARLNIGSIAYLKNYEYGAVSPMYVVFEIDSSVVTQQFLFYFIKSPKILKKINSLTEVGARFRFEFERWKRIKIPLPPIEIQNEIVKILDSFDKLVNDLTSGIPAEITARQKQYEYYREKLLTFKEK